jgi:hypothetical protein
MSVTISSGGGGGITIETDPTALKLTGGTLTGTLLVQAAGSSAFAQIVPDIDYPSITISDSGGNWMQYSSSGITFPDGSTQTTAASGGSFDGGTIASALIADGGASGQAIVDPNYEGTARVVLISSDNSQITAIYPLGIAFPDGTFQSTAYTGGGGGGGGSASEEQRMADFVAGSIGGNVNYFYGWTDYQFYCPWVWLDTSLSTLYPPNFIFQNFIQNYGWGIINDSTGTEYPVVYFDGNGFNAGDMPYESSDNWRVYVKDSSYTNHKSFRFYNNV